MSDAPRRVQEWIGKASRLDGRGLDKLITDMIDVGPIRYIWLQDMLGEDIWIVEQGCIHAARTREAVEAERIRDEVGRL